MRIVRVGTIAFPAFFEDMYRNDPGLSGLTFAEQRTRLSGLAPFLTGFERGMAAAGNEAFDLFTNLHGLESAWARENFLSANNRLEIILAHLRSLRPDVVYFQDVLAMPFEARLRLKQEVPSVKKIAVFRGAPCALGEVRDADIVFGATPHLVSELRSAGVRTELLYHAFDQDLLRFLSADRPVLGEKRPLTFFGTSGFGWDAEFQSRYWLLVELFKEFDSMQAWVDEREGLPAPWKAGFGPVFDRWIKTRSWVCAKRAAGMASSRALTRWLGRSGCPPFLKKLLDEILFERRALEKNLQVYPSERRFRVIRRPNRSLKKMFPGRCYDAKYGLEMFGMLADSEITVNRHADIVAGSLGNMRLFEATGVGACLVTDRGSNLSDLFEEGKEVVSYSSTEECVEKVRYLLDHPAERARIAAAGQARTLRDHTLQNRCRAIDSVLRNML